MPQAAQKSVRKNSLVSANDILNVSIPMLKGKVNEKYKF